MRELRLERVDRVPPAESAPAERLRELGFRPSYRAWLLRPQTGSATHRGVEGRAQRNVP
jgi:hypothetical protein